jgi:hypothetical protein
MAVIVYLNRFAKIDDFHVFTSVLPSQGLFQPIYYLHCLAGRQWHTKTKLEEVSTVL